MSDEQNDHTQQQFLLGYIRKSIIDEVEGAPSPARQKSTIRHWAERHGFQVKLYEDMDISGRYEANRPGWQDLLRDLDDPDVFGVIVESYDRSHRNLREFLAFQDDTLSPRGQALISASQNIDLNTTDGRAMASVLMTFAEMEARKASDRMKATIQYRREKEGKYFGPEPFGCATNDNQVLIPSPETYWLHTTTGETRTDKPANVTGWEERSYFDALQQMFRLYSAGDMGYADTAAALNEQGWRQKSRRVSEPHPFNLDAVEGSLKSWRVFAGELAIGIRQERRYVPGAHDPILPVELCQRVGTVLKMRSIQGPPNRTCDHIFLLSGRTFCAECGKNLDGHTMPRMKHRGLRHRYGRDGCQEPLPYLEIIEDSLLAALEEIPRQPEVYDGLIERIDTSTADAGQENSDQSRLVNLKRKLQRITELYIEGDLEKSTYKSRRTVVETEIAKLKAATSVRTPAELRSLTGEIVDQLRLLQNGTPQTKKTVIHSLVERLEISQRKIVRLVPTAKAAPFFARLMSVDVGVKPAYAYD
jgi:DNA invertase Pin-like site-specific DNA recombinase